MHSPEMGDRLWSIDQSLQRLTRLLTALVILQYANADTAGLLALPEAYRTTLQHVMTAGAEE